MTKYSLADTALIVAVVVELAFCLVKMCAYAFVAWAVYSLLRSIA